MVNRLADLFPIILIAAMASVIYAPVLIRFAPLAGLLDEPGSAPHKSHTISTPLVGGPVIALAIASAYLILRPSWTPEIMIISLGGFMVLVWGLVDDLIGLRPQYKLLGQLAVALVFLAGGIQVRFAGSTWVNGMITVVWYVGLMNAFNFVDSMDGLALGLAAIASAFFMLVTIDSGQPALAIFSAGLVGACIGVYIYNAAPARLFLGDSGAQLLGCLLAAIGVAYVPGGAGLPQGVSWFTPILVLGLPIFDTTLVVISRLRRRAPVYQPSRDHTFHRLLAKGLDPTRSVLAMQLAAIMLGLVAFVALDASVFTANLIFALILIGGLSLLILLVRQPAPKPT